MPQVSSTPSAPPLQRPISALWGVGLERTTQLARLGIHTVEDLLLHQPRRYEDRRQFRPIRDLELGEPAVTRGSIVAMGVKWFRQRQKSIFEIVLDDGTARLHCRWWNLPFMEKYFKVGDEVIVFGRPLSLKPRTVDHPESEVVEAGEESSVHLNRITPIHPLTEGLPQRWLRALIWRTLETYASQIREPHAEGGFSAAGLVTTKGELLPSRADAIRWLHFPETLEAAELARRRLAWDELLQLQCGLQLRRKAFENKASAIPCKGDNRLIKPFLAKLGFNLTAAQTRVLRELRKDMSSSKPMRRLLQGDVGSGKTVVAACCALMALESGYDVALMAPTEVLADQHYRTFAKWFVSLGVPVHLQTGRRKTAADMPSHSTGDVVPKGQCYIGTHALIESAFRPDRLGLVIIDEQQKFGVAQRERLVRKGNYPHLLVMTATPIPRTLGLTVYGELDISVIDELPPGRGGVETFLRTPDSLPKVWGFIRDKLAEGRQAYVVYPRIEDTGANQSVKAVHKEFNHVVTALKPHSVGLLHGQLPAPEQERVISAFRSGALKVLLATSLIEVGLDVSNATVMLVENAERFGLAQLHQLRGRIGRGTHTSYCVLVTADKNPEMLERLTILGETSDGFKIAEADLQLRGPGELLGQEQSGLPSFRFADLKRDFDLLAQALPVSLKLVQGR